MKDLRNILLEKLRINKGTLIDDLKFPLHVKFCGCGKFSTCKENLEKYTDIKLSNDKFWNIPTSWRVHMITIDNIDEFLWLGLFLNYYDTQEMLLKPNIEQIRVSYHNLTLGFNVKELERYVSHLDNKDLDLYWKQFKKNVMNYAKH